MSSFFSQFKRKFSKTMYKNLKINLGEMTFFKDFVNDTKGDLYPIKDKSDDCLEFVKDNRYVLESGSISRMICQFFPYATYKATYTASNADVGFLFNLVDTDARLTLNGNVLSFECNGRKEEKELASNLISEENSLIVSCRPGAFDVYLEINGKPEYQHTVYEDAFLDSNIESVFSNSYAYLYVSGIAIIKEACSYIDSGISFADIRPIKYEDGEVIQEDGKIYFTATIRMQENSFQGIFSWNYTTSSINLTGAVFYDSGDGRWRNYLAPVFIYHREKKEWLIWVSSFEHKHILAYSKFEGDPRFGVNVVDVKFMKEASPDSDITDFVGFKGDEDPDLLYDEQNGRWLLAICRVVPKIGYAYLFFESDDPFLNFRYIGRGEPGSETGGSFVRRNGELAFVCGNAYSPRSQYRIYTKHGMEIADFNHPDGGFRGWGSVFKIKAGSRTRYFWLTFDRHNGSNYGWSYGNFYCFEMI